jgi:membrane fusion protein (multidrug efflux system)
MRRVSMAILGLGLAALLAGCSEETSGRGGGHGGGSRSGGKAGGRPGMGGGQKPAAAVPVEVASVARRSISTFIETNGTLEAENEVDIVSRTAAPIVALSAEEGMHVEAGQVLARLDDKEHEVRLELSRVNLDEAEASYVRAKKLYDGSLISVEEYDSARAARESAMAQFEENRILLSYTEIRAPFAGLIVTRYVNMAEHLGNDTPVFRISDFDPLLCPIQVPERELPNLSVGQRAYLTVEAWPEIRYSASVLRIRPVVDSGTGTIRVTLQVRSLDQLRPGMFARVYLETASRSNALVIPRTALSLESLGDTVYVADGDAAARREVKLGFHEGNFVEVLEGIDESDQVIVVGQDGLGDGTPIQILKSDGVVRASSRPEPGSHAGEGPVTTQRTSEPDHSSQAGTGRGEGKRPDFSSMSPEELEKVKKRMRARGMTDEQIEQRLSRARGSAE